jgi:hypothetical protein
VDASFFGLAFLASLNPKLLALDLLLIENRRPRAMFACILAGGLGVAITIGLVDVLVVQADAITTQDKVSAGVDLAIGLILLGLGALLLTGRLPRRHRTVTAGGEPRRKPKKKGDSRMQQALRQPRLGIAFATGALVGTPGASYLAAMHHIITGGYSTATRIAAVVIFAVIEFLLIIIPWTFLELRPEGTTVLLRRSQAWLASHARQLLAWIAVILGAYLAISALVRLL